MSIESVFYEKTITVVIDNNGGLASIGQQQERLFKSGKALQLILETSHFIRFLRVLEGMEN